MKLLKPSFAAVALTCAALTTQTSRASEIAWVPDYATARAASARSGKPLFIKFYADWCPACRQLASWAERDPEVIALSRRFVMLRLVRDGDGATLKQHFGVQKIPSLLMFGASGQPLHPRIGNSTPQELAAAMRLALRRAGSPQAARAAVARSQRVHRQRTAAIRRAQKAQSAPSSPAFGGVYLLKEDGEVVVMDENTAKPRKTKARRARRR